MTNTIINNQDPIIFSQYGGTPYGGTPYGGTPTAITSAQDQKSLTFFENVSNIDWPKIGCSTLYIADVTLDITTGVLASTLNPWSAATYASQKGVNIAYKRLCESLEWENALPNRYDFAWDAVSLGGSAGIGKLARVKLISANENRLFQAINARVQAAGINAGNLAGLNADLIAAQLIPTVPQRVGGVAWQLYAQQVSNALARIVQAQISRASKIAKVGAFTFTSATQGYAKEAYITWSPTVEKLEETQKTKVTVIINDERSGKKTSFELESGSDQGSILLPPQFKPENKQSLEDSKTLTLVSTKRPPSDLADSTNQIEYTIKQDATVEVTVRTYEGQSLFPRSLTLEDAQQSLQSLMQGNHIPGANQDNASLAKDPLKLDSSFIQPQTPIASTPPTTPAPNIRQILGIDRVSTYPMCKPEDQLQEEASSTNTSPTATNGEIPPQITSFGSLGKATLLLTTSTAAGIGIAYLVGQAKDKYDRCEGSTIDKIRYISSDIFGISLVASSAMLVGSAVL